jgi:hypothetical protein
MRTIQSSFLVHYTLRCLKCNREHKFVHAPVWNIGDTIMPAAGHGDQGRCVFCRSDGLQVIHRSEVVNPTPLRNSLV